MYGGNKFGTFTEKYPFHKSLRAIIYWEKWGKFPHHFTLIEGKFPIQNGYSCPACFLGREINLDLS